MTLTIARDGSRATTSCPHCREPIDLTVANAAWRVGNPSDVADRLALQLGGLEREELHVLLLNTKNVILDQVCAYRGNVSASLVRIGELFTDAVRRTASGIILVHNHPSGDPTPSPDDIHLTAQAIAAGRLLDVEVLDHVIVAGGSFVSLRERGMAFDRGPIGRSAARGRD